MADTEEFRKGIVGTSRLPPGVVPKKLAAIRYKGKLDQPQWVDLEPGQCDVPVLTERSLIRGHSEQTTTRPCVI